MDQVEEAIASGKAFDKLVEFVEAQGGDSGVIKHPEQFEKAALSYEVKASTSGYVNHINTEQIGIASVVLGAGRETKESAIDYSAGIKLMKKYGEEVKAGEVLGILYTNKEASISSAAKMVEEAYSIGESMPVTIPHIYARVEVDKVERF